MPPKEAQQEKQEDRIEDIELLLHRERPSVEQRLRQSRGIEVTRFQVEQDIGHEQRCSRDAPPELIEFRRHEQPITDDRNRRENQKQSRKEAPHAPRIEVGDRETALADILDDDLGNQVAGDDKEDVDTDVAARERVEMRMK